MTHDEAAQQIFTSGTIQEVSTFIFCVPRVPAVCFSLLLRTQQLPSAGVISLLLHAGESTLNYRETKEVLTLH
jgi:hypothetical protein